MSLFFYYIFTEPQYLLENCPSSNLETSIVLKTHKTIQVARDYPLEQTSRNNRPLGYLDCNVRIKGLTGWERFTLVFRWFWLKFPTTQCGFSTPYLKVYNKEKRKILSACGYKYA